MTGYGIVEMARVVDVVVILVGGCGGSVGSGGPGGANWGGPRPLSGLSRRFGRAGPAPIGPGPIGFIPGYIPWPISGAIPIPGPGIMLFGPGIKPTANICSTLIIPPAGPRTRWFPKTGIVWSAWSLTSSPFRSFKKVRNFSNIFTRKRKYLEKGVEPLSCDNFETNLKPITNCVLDFDLENV